MVSKEAQRVPLQPKPGKEDTALKRLTPEDRERMGFDSWEPSLLRKMLKAQRPDTEDE